MTLQSPSSLRLFSRLALPLLLVGTQSSYPAHAAAATPDGVWSAVGPPAARYAHTAVYDPVRGRMIVFGGFEDYRANDVWALSLTGNPVWSRLLPTGAPPAGRFAHAAFYDPVRDRMIVFGADDVDFATEVWSLSLGDAPAWSLLTLGPPMPARAERSAIYDASQDRMIVFGGYDGTFHNDVWALALSGTPAWTEITPAGAPPPPRYRHSAIYDPLRQSMIVFGGESDSVFDDVWELALSGAPAWSQLAPSGTAPVARYDHTACYDETRDQMVVFGGSDDTLHADVSLHNDVWALSLGASPQWTQIATAGTPPTPRYRHTAIYDAAADRMVVFAGSDPNRKSDLFLLAMTPNPTWSRALSSGSPPSVRVGHTATYDPEGDRMFIYGGIYGEPVRSDTRALSPASSPRWSSPTLAGPPPPPRVNHCAAYDPVRRRIVYFGGYNVAFDYANDLWALTLQGTPTWGDIQPAGTRPPGRWLPSLIYDPLRDRMILFGGYGGFDTFYNDVWELSLSGTLTWTKLTPGGTPPSPRWRHTAIYDPVRDRMIVFGGGGGEVWALSLAGIPQWTQLAPLGTPPIEDIYHTAVYDPVRDRMIVYINGVWALSLAGTPTWTQLSPAGLIPPNSNRHAAIYDPVRDQMIAFGGEDHTGGVATNDTWALDFGDPVKPAASCDADRGWQAGSVLDLRYAISHPLSGTRAVEWTLSGDRDWPGLPAHGIVIVDGATPESLVVPVAVPDTAAAGTNSMTLTVAFAGGAGNDSSCVHDIHDVLTAVLASLITAEAEPGLVRLAWRVTGSGATIQRRTETSDWSTLAAIGPDGLGNLTYEDRSVTPGTRYGYRLTWMGPRGPVVAGEVWLEVPRVAELALLGVRPVPARGAMDLAFTLPERGAVRVALFDLAGRRAAPPLRLQLSAGYHLVPLAQGAHLAPGIYVVELGFGERHLRTRAVVVR